MITEIELFEQGWRRYGDEENDIYYKLMLKADVFGLYDLSGNLNSNGIFRIYSMNNRDFNKISQLDEIIKINRFVINWDIVKRYGSDTPISANKISKNFMYITYYLGNGVKIFDKYSGNYIDFDLFYNEHLPEEFHSKLGKIGLEQLFKDSNLKLVLHPMSGINKKSIYFNKLSENLQKQIDFGLISPNYKDLKFIDIEILLEHHVDVFNLIDSDLALYLKYN